MTNQEEYYRRRLHEENFGGNRAPSQAMQSHPAGTYQPGQGGGASKAGAALGLMAAWGWSALTGWLAAKAVKNHYAYSGDAVESAWLGATAGRRWSNWIGFTAYTLLWFMAPIVWLACVPILLVIYNRNIDASLFKRGWLYQLVRPLAALTNWLPNAALYTALVIAPWVITSVV